MRVTSSLFKCVLEKKMRLIQYGVDLCTFLTWWVGVAGWWVLYQGLGVGVEWRQRGGPTAKTEAANPWRTSPCSRLPTSWEVEIMWASGLRMWSRQEQEQWHLAYKSCHLAKISTKIMCLGHFQLLDKTAWMHLKCVLCKRIYTFYFSHMSET